MWAKAGPLFCAQVEANIENRDIRYKVIDGFGALWRFKQENLIRSENTLAMDQIIDYPKVSDGSRYTFSLWAFPEELYPTVLPQYFEFCKKYECGAEAISQQHALRRLPDYEGSPVAALLFVGRQRDDHRPGLYRESRLDHFPARVQPVLQRSRRHSRCPIRRRW